MSQLRDDRTVRYHEEIELRSIPCKWLVSVMWSERWNFRWWNSRWSQVQLKDHQNARALLELMRKDRAFDYRSFEWHHWLNVCWSLRYYVRLWSNVDRLVSLVCSMVGRRSVARSPSPSKRAHTNHIKDFSHTCHPYRENFEDIPSAWIILSSHPVSIEILAEAMCDFTGESIVFPVGRIETKDSFPLQIETFLEY